MPRKYVRTVEVLRAHPVSNKPDTWVMALRWSGLIITGVRYRKTRAGREQVLWPDTRLVSVRPMQGMSNHVISAMQRYLAEHTTPVDSNYVAEQHDRKATEEANRQRYLQKYGHPMPDNWSYDGFYWRENGTERQFGPDGQDNL